MNLEQRNQLREDRARGMRTEALSEKYQLSEVRVYQIIKGEEYNKGLVRRTVERNRLRSQARWEKGVLRKCSIRTCPKTFTAHANTERRCKEHVGKELVYGRPAYVHKVKVCAVPGCNKEFTVIKSVSTHYCGEHIVFLKGLEGRDLMREVVRMRDKHTCKECKKKWSPSMRRFDVHHLNGLCGQFSRKYDSQHDLEGLTTLCHKCHMKNHASKKMKGMLGKTTELKKRAVVALSSLGWTQGEIQDATGVKQPTISKILR